MRRTIRSRRTAIRIRPASRSATCELPGRVDASPARAAAASCCKTSTRFAATSTRKGDIAGLDTFYRDGLEMVTNTKAQNAFDIHHEPDKLREQLWPQRPGPVLPAGAPPGRGGRDLRHHPGRRRLGHAQATTSTSSRPTCCRSTTGRRRPGRATSTIAACRTRCW